MSKFKKKDKEPLHVSTARALALAAVLTVFGIVFTYCFSWGHVQNIIETTAETDVFRSFVLETLDGGKLEAEELHKTSLTAVNVWGTDCSPCIYEMPDLEELNSFYEDSVFRVIGIPCDVTDQGKEVIPERIQEANRILESCCITYTNVIPDESMDAFLTMAITGTPTTLFIDDEGNIVGSVTGTRDIEFWKETVDDLLSEVA